MRLCDSPVRLADGLTVPKTASLLFESTVVSCSTGFWDDRLIAGVCADHVVGPGDRRQVLHALGEGAVHHLG
jgi:hypothetical protein